MTFIMQMRVVIYRPKEKSHFEYDWFNWFIWNIWLKIIICSWINIDTSLINSYEHAKVNNLSSLFQKIWSIVHELYDTL